MEMAELLFPNNQIIYLFFCNFCFRSLIITLVHALLISPIIFNVLRITIDFKLEKLLVQKLV